MVLDAWIGPALALAVVSALAFVGFRLYGRRVGGPAGAHRIRRSLAVGLPVVAVLSVLAIAAGGLADAIDVSLAAVGAGGGPIESGTTYLALAFGVLAATTAGYAGALPAALAIRDLDATRGLALRRFVRWAGAIVGLMAVLLFGSVQLASATGNGLYPILVGVAVLVYLAGPWLGRIGTPTRAPTAEERRRVDVALGELDFEPGDVVVFEVANEMASVSIRGLPGRRTLFLADHLLDAYDDVALRVVLAANANRTRRLYTEYRLTVAVGSVLAGALALTESPRPLLGFLVVVVAVGVLLWIGSRLVYAADAETAALLGSGTVVWTYRTIAEDAALDGGRLQAFLRMRPRMQDRIQRLADAS